MAALLDDQRHRADQCARREAGHGSFFRAIWPRRAITSADGWYKWVDKGEPKKQSYYICRRDGRPALCASIGQFTETGRVDNHGLRK